MHKIAMTENQARAFYIVTLEHSQIILSGKDSSAVRSIGRIIRAAIEGTPEALAAVNKFRAKANQRLGKLDAQEFAEPRDFNADYLEGFCEEHNARTLPEPGALLRSKGGR